MLVTDIFILWIILVAYLKGNALIKQWIFLSKIIDCNLIDDQRTVPIRKFRPYIIAFFPFVNKRILEASYKHCMYDINIIQKLNKVFLKIYIYILHKLFVIFFW